MNIVTSIHKAMRGMRRAFPLPRSPFPIPPSPLCISLVALCATSAFAAGTLPAGYTEIEYIQGPGNARIVTDYRPAPNTDKIEAVVEWPANTIAANVNQAVWCARGSGLQVDSWTLFVLGTQFRFDYMPSGHTVSLTSTFTIATGTKYTITAEDNTITYSANGTVLLTQSTPAYSYTAGSVLALFSSHYNGINANLGNYGKQRLYSFKVWRSGELIHYFVPCKDSGGTATLVDICDNPATLTRSGTFTAGAAGHYFDDSLFSSVAILPIPKQMCLTGVTPEPGFTVTNFVSGAYWTFAEGGVAPGATPFDVAYGFADGVGTVTVTGKAGGDYEGVTLTKDYLFTDNLLVNGGFEAGSLAPGWTGSAQVINSSNGHGPDNTTFFISGTWCGMLKMPNYSSAEQVFTNSIALCATLFWKCKHRCNYNSTTPVYYTVLLDGEVIQPEEKVTGSDVQYRRIDDLVLNPGEHTLVFQGRTDNNADQSLFLDDVSLAAASTNCLTILPIANQSCVEGPCRPEFVVSNLVNGSVWTVGGDIVHPLLDVEYANNAAIGTATVKITGKGGLAGEVRSRTFAVVEDENVVVEDGTARRIDVGGNAVYVFTNVAAQTVTAKRDLFIADCLLVGGGGGGGRTMGAGGGGGGVNAIGAVGTFVPVGNAFTVVVGAGGAGSTANNVKGGNGGDTSLGFGSFAVTAQGGGGGGSWENKPGANGGSGGGGCREGAGGTGIVGLGFAGAAGLQSNTAKAGGGGGAGHAGYQYTTEDGTHTGNGGEGVSNRITGAWVVYGGGGGAGGSSNGYGTPDAGRGGLGGGGDGSKSNIGANGTDGLGGGGGGGGYASSGSFFGGNGGSGVAIIALAPVDFKVDAIPAQHVKSGGCTPEPVVHCGDTLLVKGTDYTVAYANNTAPGIATITITGIGTYAGKGGYAAFEILNRYCAKTSVAEEGDGSSWAKAMSWTNALAVVGASSQRHAEIWLSGDMTHAAAPATLTFTRPMVIRGGFAGTEDSLDERAAGAKSTFDGQGAYTVMTISNGAGAPVVLDGFRIFNGARGIVKTGAGDFTILNSEIVGNKTIAGGQTGIGCSFTGSASTSLVVSNCVVSGNGSGPTLITTLGSGQGLYAKTFGSVVIEETVFLTNGLAWTAANLWNEGRDGQAGAAIFLDGVPATVRRCVFRGNRGSCYSNRGGIVRVSGTCDGTLFDHCVFAGNEEDYHWRDETTIPNGGSNGGQIAISLSSETDRVTIRNCTLACNFSDNSKSAAGVTVAKGTVVIKNSVIANNIVHSSNSGGADLALMADVAHAEVSHSVLSADGPSSHTSLIEDNLSFGNGMRFGNPLLVSSTNDVDSLLVIISNARKLRQFDKTKLDEVLGLDVHPLSPAGYFTNDGVEHVSDGEYSPAVDAGDSLDPVGAEPSPNGGTVNAGAYGGTAQASKTPAGAPAVDGAVTVTFDGDYSQPTVHFTVGGTGAFYAQAQVYVSTNNVDWTLMDTIVGLAKGASVDTTIMAYYAPGSIWAKVLLVADGHEATATSAETPVTKPLPPWTGKGGPANVIHVRPGAIGSGTGDNWSDAVPDLWSAYSHVSAEKNEIWIAGTNVLKTGSVSLSAASPLVIRGGFRGWENAQEERPEGFRSVIDGDNVTECLVINNAAAASLERIHFTRALNCALIKTGAGDMRVADCHFLTNGTDQATNVSGKGARVSGTKTTTLVTFTNCVFRGNHVKPGSSGGCPPRGGGIYASSLKCLRLEDCSFVHNGSYLREPGGANSYFPSTGECSGSAVYSTAPVSAIGCRFAANFGTVRYSAARENAYGGTVRLLSGAEGSAFTNCAWVANADQLVWPGTTTEANNAAGALSVRFGSNSGMVDVQNCTFAYNLADGYEVTAGLNLILGTANVRNSVFFGNRLDALSSARGADLSLRGDSVCNVAYTLFGEDGTNSITCAATATTNFLGGVVYGDPLFVTDDATMAALVKKSGNYIFWDWTAATAPATYAALEAANAHLRGGCGYYDETTGALVTDYARKPHSPAIDAGDPKSDYRIEPQVPGVGGHGHRVNLGAYGNTPWATMSSPRGTMLIMR